MREFIVLPQGALHFYRKLAIEKSSWDKLAAAVTPVLEIA